RERALLVAELARRQSGRLAVELVEDLDVRVVVRFPGRHGVADLDLAVVETFGRDVDVGVPGERGRGQHRSQDKPSKAESPRRSEAETGPHVVELLSRTTKGEHDNHPRPGGSGVC